MTVLKLNSHTVITDSGYAITPFVRREYDRVITGFEVTTEHGYTHEVTLTSDGTSLDVAATQVDVHNGPALVARLTVADPMGVR